MTQTKTTIPSEEEVRRYFQEHSYVTMSYDSETNSVSMKYKDLTNLVYPNILETDND